MVSDFRVESLVSMYASSRSRHVYSEYSVNGAPQSGNLPYSWFLSCLIKKSAFIVSKRQVNQCENDLWYSLCTVGEKEHGKCYDTISLWYVYSIPLPHR